MIKDKSDFGTFAVPDVLVQIVEQSGSTMNVHTVETTGKKTTTADVSYFIDGSSAQNVINGHNAESKAFWDGAALMIRTTELINGDQVVMEDRWELSADAQTLIRTSHITSVKGGVDLKLVCEKEKLPG